MKTIASYSGKGIFSGSSTTVLLTGASGLVGHALLLRLLQLGWNVHVLVRDVARARLPQSSRLKVFVGDINEPDTILPAMQGCKGVFHLAAMVQPVCHDRAALYRTNVGGTRHVLEAALQCKVERVVFTSTCGVSGPSINHPLEEDDPRMAPFMLDYDASKQLAEDVVAEYRQKGLDCIIVRLAKVFGEGEERHALAFNSIIKAFLRRRFILLPRPANLTISVAFLDDVVEGHVLAMIHGHRNEKYFLSGHSITQEAFFKRVAAVAGVKAGIWLLPQLLMRGAAWVYAGWKRVVFGKPVGVPPVAYLFHSYNYSSDRAFAHLGYTLTPLHEAIRRTVHYLQGHPGMAPVIRLSEKEPVYATAP